jgi:hypothetical protein
MYHSAVATTLYPLEALARGPRPAGEVGGKAFHLARLVAAGLPVPEGFVIAAPASAADPVAVERAAAALGEPMAVRSSASIEDGAERAAPGLFATRLGVKRDQLASAIADVVASRERAAVAEYLGVAAPPAMAVVVQRQVNGVAGVLYTRAPAGDDVDTVWLESGSCRAVMGRDGSAREVDADFPLERVRLGELVALGLAAEQAVAADRRGADVEWVATRDRLWLVQARPRTGRLATPTLAPEVEEAIRFSRGDPRTWRWDAAHNPDPLSPAQEGLVELVGDLGDQEMRVVAGYLYTAPRARRSVASADEDVVRLFTARAAPAMERALAPVEGEGAPA